MGCDDHIKDAPQSGKESPVGLFSAMPVKLIFTIEKIYRMYM